MFNSSTQPPPQFQHMALIGCGLMGSSLALAAKRKALVVRVQGCDQNPAHAQAALRQGAIDQALEIPAQAVAGADLVVLAIPVGAMAAVLADIVPHLQPRALVMDMGSTKATVVQAAQAALGARAGQFVGAHPMAGKHLWGPDHADAALLETCRVFITPSVANSQEILQQAQNFWQALGSYVSVCTPEAHDEAMAAISHLPHFLAFALMNSLGTQKEVQSYLALAGNGFKDFTRIAGAEPTLWRDVFVANAPALLKQLGYFKQALGHLESLVQNASENTNVPVPSDNSETPLSSAAAALHQCIAKASRLRRESLT